jgi:hypothetical protein
MRTCGLSQMHRSSFHFSDPIHHENLTLQFLLGPFVPPDYLTLTEGCRLGIVEILETGTVGRLSVHNRSPKKPLFIQLGELLKGGLQDRTIATDLVLDPGEQYDGLSVYCVEQARWSKRHEEDHKKFVSTQDFVATKPLRSSLERREDQRAVWAAVASAKHKMAHQLPGYLGSQVSSSSLQLSLEDAVLQKNVQQWFPGDQWTSAAGHENRRGSNRDQRSTGKDRLVRACAIVPAFVARTASGRHPGSITRTRAFG